MLFLVMYIEVTAFKKGKTTPIVLSVYSEY